MGAATGIISNSCFRDPGMKPPWTTAAGTGTATGGANPTVSSFLHATRLVSARDTYARVIRVAAGSQRFPDPPLHHFVASARSA